MAKVMTIQEKKESLERELKRLEAFDIAIKKLEQDMFWECCVPKTDDDGNYVRDDNGDIIFNIPEKDDWSYDRYVAYKAVIDEIKALV